jgi:hypothetical protein
MKHGGFPGNLVFCRSPQGWSLDFLFEDFGGMYWDTKRSLGEKALTEEAKSVICSLMFPRTPIVIGKLDLLL